MAFDIHQLDNIDFDNSKTEKILERYQARLFKKFSKSTEGEKLLQTNPEAGHWAIQLIYFGFSYIGITLPNMDITDIEEIITELFPRKITLSSPDEANEIIPELTAFWVYLKREFNLKNSDRILKYLDDISSEYYDIMNDPSRFGMAKSFMTAGKSAGFDMTNESDLQKFAALYNASLSAPSPTPLSGSAHPSSNFGVNKNKKKKRNKIAKSSRKKNRKKR